MIATGHSAPRNDKERVRFDNKRVRNEKEDKCHVFCAMTRALSDAEISLFIPIRF